LISVSWEYPPWYLWHSLCASARLAQSVERKALNLVVAGSSPTVGVNILYTQNKVTLAGVSRKRQRQRDRESERERERERENDRERARER
jgi:hypothetical protein